MADVFIDTNMASPTFNCYSSVADADQFFANRLQADTWNNADDPTKTAALVWGSNLINTSFIWEGARVVVLQPMTFPRYGLYDAEGYYIRSDTIPKQVIMATQELAQWLILKDRTMLSEPTSVGLKGLSLGSMRLDFDKEDRPQVIPMYIRNILQGLFKQLKGSPMAVGVIRT